MVADPKLTKATSVPSQRPSNRSQLRSQSSLRTRTVPRQRPATNQQPFPLLLRILLWMQHTSTFVALGAIGISLASYGLMVYTQQQWNQQYEQLQQLQQKERNLRTMNESLKEKIPSKPPQDKNWTPLTPDKTLYVQPTTIEPFQPEPSPDANEDSQSSQMERPLGY